MARKTKEVVIAELTAKGIKFDENTRYNDLSKLLKNAAPEPDAAALKLSVPEKTAVADEEGNITVLSTEGYPMFPTELVERAKKIGFTLEQIATYTDPEKLKMACDNIKPLEQPVTQIKLTSKIPKRNTFLPDAYRDERDAEVLRGEIGKREHKGKIKTIITIKQMDVSSDGFWITEFTIDLKE